MNRITFKLPNGANIYSALFGTNNPDFLSSDLLAIDLGNGIFIDVGWLPEHDPNGNYRICAFNQDWRTQVIDPIFTSDLNELTSMVQELIYGLSKDVVSIPNTATQRIKHDFVNA